MRRTRKITVSSNMEIRVDLFCSVVDSLSDKFGRISPFGQKKTVSVASKFNEWKKRK